MLISGIAANINDAWYCGATRLSDADKRLYCTNEYLYPSTAKICHCLCSLSPRLYASYQALGANESMNVSLLPGPPLIDINCVVRNPDGSVKLKVHPLSTVLPHFTARMQQVNSSQSKIVLNLVSDKGIDPKSQYPSADWIDQPLTKHEVSRNQNPSIIAGASQVAVTLTTTSVSAPTTLVVSASPQYENVGSSSSTQRTGAVATTNSTIVTQLPINQQVQLQPVVGQNIAPIQASLDTVEERTLFVHGILPPNDASGENLQAINTLFNLSAEQVAVILRIFDLDNGRKRIKLQLQEEVNQTFNAAGDVDTLT